MVQGGEHDWQTVGCTYIYSAEWVWQALTTASLCSAVMRMTRLFQNKQTKKTKVAMLICKSMWNVCARENTHIYVGMYLYGWGPLTV